MTRFAAVTNPKAATILKPSKAQAPKPPVSVGRRGVMTRPPSKPASRLSTDQALIPAGHARLPSIDPGIGLDRAGGPGRRSAAARMGPARRADAQAQRCGGSQYLIAAEDKDRQQLVEARVVGLVGGIMTPELELP